MRLVVGKSGLGSLEDFTRLSAKLSSGKLGQELHRGVVDAGRRTKTPVQKAVMVQMALKPGKYQSYVVAGTRGVSRKEILAYDIFGVKGGAPITDYLGLKSVKASSRMNNGLAAGDRGTVRSSVWNNPRIFKRSFATDANFYAMLPPGEGASTRAPKAFWTFGRKPKQPRGAMGRFAKSGTKYGKVRKLFGPSLMKELPEDVSLATFYAVAPIHLEREVGKRLNKLMRF